MGLRHSPDANANDTAAPRHITVYLRWAMLLVAVVFYTLHFVHLDADFPNHSPWVDWSKYTDEGWYSGAAVRHYLTGHWYWKGDFNPAVALPMWPAAEWVFFKFAGVSTYSARSLALLMFGVTLVAMYLLVERHSHGRHDADRPSLAGAMCVLMLCCSPFLYAFERMAIVEPLLIALTTLAVFAASHLVSFPRPSERRLRAMRKDPRAIRSISFSVGKEASEAALQMRQAHVRSLVAGVALGVLMPAMVLTKTTALFLLPAVFYMVWAQAGYSLRRTVQLTWLPCVLGLALWCVYFFGVVRPHYLEDYRYLFSANAYTDASTTPLHMLIVKTVGNTVWIGLVLYALLFIVLALAILWHSRLFANPLVPTLLIWAVGYLLFIGYHFNLQPRYYTVVAVPVTAFVCIGLDHLRDAGRRRNVALVAVGVCVLAVAVPDAVQQMRFVLHPEYTFRQAAEGIKRIVQRDANHSRLLLSISGADLTLMTGLPSICDDFGTLTLDDRVKAYKPGWFAAWNELDDDKMDAIGPLFQPVRVAEFPVMDDADRNLLILYRLDPADASAPRKHRRKAVPKPLQTKLGQQPSVDQLQH